MTWSSHSGARSSAGEHYLDMVGVTGSIPVAPTIHVGLDPSWVFADPFDPSENPRRLCWSQSGPSKRDGMATIRKHRRKWQVRVRRDGVTLTRSFTNKRDA